MTWTGAREWLSMALERLLGSKPYSKVRVTELTRTAGVNRATFYSHFDNLDSMVLELFEQRLREIMAKRLQGSGEEGVPITALVQALLDHWGGVRLRCRDTYRRFESPVEAKVLEVLKATLAGDRPSFGASAAAGAVYAVARQLYISKKGYAEAGGLGRGRSRDRDTRSSRRGLLVPKLRAEGAAAV